MTSLLSLLRAGINIQQNSGFRQLVRSGGYYAYESLLRTYHTTTDRVTRGQQVFSQDWDVLLVLDACRLDLMNEVGPEYRFCEGIGSFRSLGSSSLQWLERNFSPDFADEMANTTYITGNPYSEQAVQESDFHAVDEVWRYDWDEEIGTIQPRSLTDRAIHHWRNNQPEQMIVHYMQPHAPFINHDLQAGISPDSWEELYTGEKKNVWMRLRDGEIPKQTVWEAYKDNLRAVLDDVELLLENIDAQSVVITSDHGNGLGEHGIYGHPSEIDSDVLRTVPWIETSATDEETYDPQTQSHSAEQDDVKSKLADLGYL